jgi:hypothetical protein
MTVSKLYLSAIIIPLGLLLFDYYMSRFNFHKPTHLGIRQPVIHLDKETSLIDIDKGTVALSGWGNNIEQNIIVNHWDAAPLSLSLR